MFLNLNPTPGKKQEKFRLIARLFGRSFCAGGLLKTNDLEILNLRQPVVRAVNTLCTSLSTAACASGIFGRAGRTPSSSVNSAG
jgi:hypothetical protein